MRRLVTAIILSLALLAVFTGCNSHPPLTGLTFDLLKLERTADGSVTATLQVVNGTVVSFNVAKSKHQVFLNGRFAGTIDIGEPMGIPSQRTMPLSGVLKLEGGALTPGPASYRLESAVTLILYGDTKEVQKMTGTGTVQVP